MEEGRGNNEGEVSFRFGEFIRTETSLLSLYSSTTIPVILLAWEIHRSGTAWKNSDCENEVKQTSSAVAGEEEREGGREG